MKTIELITLRALSTLETVAMESSFSEAGRKLGLPRAVVSQMIAQLEAQVDAKLFRRTTRKVVLTEHGEALIARISPALADIRAGLLSTRAQSGNLAGDVRLSVSHALGRHFVLPALPAFRAQYPEVRVEVLLADGLDDLIVESLDLTIRMGELPDSSMVAKRLGTLPVVLVASSNLLATLGTPKTPEKLRACPAIGFRIPGSGSLYPWKFETKGERVAVVPERLNTICNSMEGVVDLVRQGQGIAAVPRYLVEKDIASGDLKILLERYKLPSIPVHLYFASRAHMARRVRLLADHLSESIKRMMAA